MNKTLERAVTAASCLPEEAQEAIGSLILEELGAEQGWTERFGRSGGTLAEMARRARARHARGETTELEFPLQE